MKASPSIQLIRNATLLLKYAGHQILVDPMFSPRGTMGSISGKGDSPLVDLPIPIDILLQGTELVLVTHTHPDHFDQVASNQLPKTIDLFYQPADEATIEKEGFTNACAIIESTRWNEIEIYRTGGQHGSGEVLNYMGTVSGYVLKAEGQPTLYIVGDSIYIDEIRENIRTHKPDYIIINSGGAIWPGYPENPLLMNETEALSLVQENTDAKVIAVHMDAIDHCMTTRASLHQKANELEISNDRLLIPTDGEAINL